MKDNEREEKEEQATAEPAVAEEKDVAAAVLGKFKDANALAAAYLSLEAEFTRRSKRLKELEQANKAQEMPQGAPSQENTMTEEELISAAVESPAVKQAVIGQYLRDVANNKAFPLMVGGVSTAAPRNAPKSVREAGALAEKFLDK